MADNTHVRIAIMGAGTIGLSFAALHLTKVENCDVTIYDTRPDIKNYIYETLPRYISSLAQKENVDSLFASGHLQLATSIQAAVQNANIVQEQGPEDATFKQLIWKEIEIHAQPDCLFWSSSSGIPASTQSTGMLSPTRLIVVHPYNPPHIMPLLEIVPSPSVDPQLVERTLEYWKGMQRVPVLLQKECTGFVSNRLAFALLREAVHLVHDGVISAHEVDMLVENSMGPRWAIAGPFKSYHLGGGAGGIDGFMKNVGGTVQACWDDLGVVDVGGSWEANVFQQIRLAYGDVKEKDLRQRDEITEELLNARNRVLENVGRRWGGESGQENGL